MSPLIVAMLQVRVGARARGRAMCAHSQPPACGNNYVCVEMLFVGFGCARARRRCVYSVAIAIRAAVGVAAGFLLNFADWRCAACGRPFRSTHHPRRLLLARRNGGILNQSEAKRKLGAAAPVGGAAGDREGLLQSLVVKQSID